MKNLEDWNKTRLNSLRKSNWTYFSEFCQHFKLRSSSVVRIIIYIVPSNKAVLCYQGNTAFVFFDQSCKRSKLYLRQIPCQVPRLVNYNHKAFTRLVKVHLCLTKNDSKHKITIWCHFKSADGQGPRRSPGFGRVGDRERVRRLTESSGNEHHPVFRYQCAPGTNTITLFDPSDGTIILARIWWMI